MKNFEYYITWIIKIGLPIYGIFFPKKAAKSIVRWNKMINFDSFSENSISILIFIISIFLLSLSIYDLVDSK
jgi:hypothetical protein